MEKIQAVAGVKKIPRLRGLTLGRTVVPPLPEVGGGGEPEVTVDITPEEEKLLRQRLPGEERLIKRVLALKGRFPEGTLPELVAYDWLQREGQHFRYQVEANGGRRQLGGSIPDFLVFQSTHAMVWRIMGEYWHSMPAKIRRDQMEKIRLLVGGVDGQTVDTVVDLWESDIYGKRPQVFEYALAGIGLRG